MAIFHLISSYPLFRCPTEFDSTTPELLQCWIRLARPCSLETFTLQFHIWMAADTKGVLGLGIFQGNGSLRFDRWREFVLLTPIFLWVSWQVASATVTITKWLTDDERNERLPGGEVKRRESDDLVSAQASWKTQRELLLKDVGPRFLMLLAGLWILNLATG